MSRYDDASRPGDDMFSGGDRYRPSTRRRFHSPPGLGNRGRSNDGPRDWPSHRPRQNDDYARATDSYRPRPPQGDFNFRFEKPAGILPFDDFPNHPPDRGSSYRGRRAFNRKPGRSRGFHAPHPSERALISGDAFRLPEERLHDPQSAAKFRNLDELSDDDELDMEISSASSPSNPEAPAEKRPRTEPNGDAPADVPKWSNPDPYTALPCPDETTRKKRDMVKFIRKARIEEKAPAEASTAQAENFISFDNSSDEGGDVPAEPSPPTAVSPTARRAVGKDSSRDGHESLGSRKRTADGEIKAPDYGQLRKATSRPCSGSLLSRWLPKGKESNCPWATVDHSADENMAVRLHKEILDFYYFVRPREFEQAIRTRLVDNLSKAMKRDGRHFGSAQVHAFGSFMSGLYLPTADMDLVVCSASYMTGGPPVYLGSKSWLFKFQRFLVAQGLADSDAIEVIAHARVPLVKYVDKVTGLKVDVSFENLGGVQAVETFSRWKRDYPAMPILVTLIKHFLLMRGLNEPVNGGIGGFSVICLVVSMLQILPQVQSRSVKAEHHLGELLLDFLELYGRHFRYYTVAISLTNPVGYVRKSDVSTFIYKNTKRLSIIDPNNPANDIAGGSSNIAVILSQFNDAYSLLHSRMMALAKRPNNHSGGILDVILKGDYSSFQQQREHLKRIHEQTIGPCSD